MGLSLRNITKKIGDVAGAVERQVNPFDNGATASNPAGNGQHQSVLQQAGHAAGGIISAVGKPLAQFPLDVANEAYNNAVAPALSLPKFHDPRSVPGLEGNVATAVGADGTVHQLLTSGAQTALTIGTGGIDDLAETAASRVLPKVLPKFVSTLVPKVATGAVTGAGFGGLSAAGANESPEEILKATGEGAAAGAALPVAARGIKVLPKAALKTASAVNSGTSAAIERYKAVNKAEDAIDIGKTGDVKAVQSIKDQGKAAGVAAKQAPQASITPEVAPSPAPAPIKVKVPTKVSTGIPEVDKAINDVAAQYAKPNAYDGDINRVTEQVSGNERVGNRLASKLGAVLKKSLTPEENQAVEDFLDGHPTSALTAKALKVANALKTLRDPAHAVRAAVKPSIGKVVDYSPRISADDINLKGIVKGTVNGIKTKVGQTLGGKFNLNSRFSESRVNDKFISGKKTLLGNPTKLGLKDAGNGNFRDAQGHVFKRVHATKDELEAAGHGPFARRTSSVNRIYHGDTLSLKAKADAVTAISKDPNKFGLFTQKQIDDGVAPKDVKAVTGVKGLDGLYASEKDATNLTHKLGFDRKSTPLGLRAFDAVSNAATQAIVLNPFFHGMNQLYQAGIAAGNLPGLKGLPGHGWVSVAKAFANVTEDDLKTVAEKGAGGSDYGAYTKSVLANLTHGATKLNTKALAAYELRLRAALYKTSIEKGMSSADAVKNINTFLGDTKHVNDSIRRATLFAHYFKTMAKAMGTQLKHPVEQRGALANTAALAAIVAATSYGYQKLTGNQNAYVRAPGELGLAKEAIESGKEIAEGQFPSIVTNRINPVVKEAGQQLFDKDIFTGQAVTDSAGGRLGHAESALVAPVATASKVTSGKRNLVEAASNQFGLNTPHAKGYKASEKIPALNTPKALAGNGEAAQNDYFDALHTAQQSVKGNANKSVRDKLTTYIDRSKDPVTGQNIQNSPADSITNSRNIATDDKFRGVLQKFEASQPSHDPVWDLPDAQLKAYMQYKAQYTGDAQKTVLAQQNDDKYGQGWTDAVTAASNKFYDTLPVVPGAKAPKANAQTPTYPKFDTGTQSLLDQYNTALPDQKSSLISANGGELSDAFNKIAVWTNKMRKAEGALEKTDYPVADAATESAMKVYNALPKGNGPKGGSPDRAAWINANPSRYALIQNYLTKTSIQSLITNASEAQFKGTTPNQELLKDIKNVDQYDIATSTDGKGGTAYSVNPSAAYAQSTGSSYQYQKKYYAKGNTTSGILPKAKIKSVPKPKLTFTKGKSGKSGKAKVALKPSKV